MKVEQLQGWEIGRQLGSSELPKLFQRLSLSHCVPALFGELWAPTLGRDWSNSF